MCILRCTHLISSISFERQSANLFKSTHEGSITPLEVYNLLLDSTHSSRAIILDRGSTETKPDSDSNEHGFDPFALAFDPDDGAWFCGCDMAKRFRGAGKE